MNTTPGHEPVVTGCPIALGWHPYNRCTLWRCHHCNAAFLRYTEYGGYYQDDRIRPLLAHLIVTPEPGRV